VAPKPIETVRSSRIRESGWLVFPLLGMLAAVAAEIVHRAVAWSGSVGAWRAAEPWVPTIVPAHAGYTVAPWPALIWLGLLFALGTSLAASSLIVRRTLGRRPWWVRALALWGCAVVVAVGVAGIAQLGEWVLWTGSFGGLGGSFIRTFTLPALLEAARWGLIWGLVPAAATALISAPRPGATDRRRAVRAGAVILVMLVVSGMCLAAATHGAALSARTEVAQPAGSAPPGETAAPEPTDPPSELATTEDPAFPGRCSPDDVVVDIAGTDAAVGSRYLTLEARNVSSDSCALDGTPDLAFADQDGNAVRPAVAPRNTTSTGEPIDGEAVTLAPGAVARADLVWRAPTGRPSEFTVLMAPWAGAVRTAATETLDVVDGGEMTLSPWYPGE
jgi:hypothetical protein